MTSASDFATAANTSDSGTHPSQFSSPQAGWSMTISDSVRVRRVSARTHELTEKCYKPEYSHVSRPRQPSSELCAVDCANSGREVGTEVHFCRRHRLVPAATHFRQQ